jgi:hypothetical protein
MNKKKNDEPELPDQKSEESPEQRNVYEYQMNSTETALLPQDEFWKLKLVS